MHNSHPKFKLHLIICGILSLFIISGIFVIKYFRPTYSASNDVYDVILFWGQSNMVGYAGTQNRELVNGEYLVDPRVNNYGLDDFSYKSGISGEILKNNVYVTYNQVNINYGANTVFDYNYINNELIDLSSAGYDYKVGEYLYYNQSTNTLNGSRPSGAEYSIFQAKGTNITQYFSKLYNGFTSRKVVIVLASNGGEEIANFLPHDRVLLESSDTNKDKYIYEALVKKYQAAIKYLNDNNKTIGRKFYVSMQGEADVDNNTDENTYVNRYVEVHNNLKNDLGIDFGVLIETSTKIGNNKRTEVEAINNAQERIISENADIILGSDFSYRYYCATSGETPPNNKKTCITNINNAKLAVCEPTNNTIHFTSAGLSQIGKEAAIRTISYLNNKNYINITFHKNDGSEATVNQNLRHKANADEVMRFGYYTNGTLRWGSTVAFDNWTRNGYSLSGWAVKPSATTRNYRVDNQVSDEWITNNTPTKDIFAVWEPVSYTINYTLNGGTNNISNPSSYTIESNNITLANPTRNGYVFTGWTGSNGTTAQTTVTIPTGSYGNKSYTANWIANKYTINFNKNNNAANGTTNSLTNISYDSYATLPNNGYSLTNYEFKGWSTTTDGPKNYNNGEEILINNIVSELGIENTNNASINLYAIWEQVDFPTSLMPTLDTNAPYEKIKIIATTELTGNVQYRFRMKISGASWQTWSSWQNNNTYIYDNLKSSTTYVFNVEASNETHTMTASNSIVTAPLPNLVISFDSNGGTNISNKTVTYKNSYGTLEQPTKENYMFIGWYKENTFSTIVNSDTIVENKNNHTLYAKYELLASIINDNTNYSISSTIINGFKDSTLVTNYTELGNNMTSKIYRDSTEKQSGYIATGDTLKIYQNGQNIGNYDIIIKGDVTGDGTVSIADVAKLFQHYRKTNIIPENDYYYIMAGDTTLDGVIKLTDVAKTFQYVRGAITRLD